MDAVGIYVPGGVCVSVGKEDSVAVGGTAVYVSTPCFLEQEEQRRRTQNNIKEVLCLFMIHLLLLFIFPPVI